MDVLKFLGVSCGEFRHPVGSTEHRTTRRQDPLKNKTKAVEAGILMFSNGITCELDFFNVSSAY
jgi:hypothetical protein